MTHTTRILIEEAVVLHDKDGQILAHDLETELPANLCDSCDLPTYDERNGHVYRLMNMFKLPGFKHPVLLLDTSTFEGRALALLTFTEEYKVTSFSIYEYVINCGPK